MSEEKLQEARIEYAVVELSEKLALENPGTYSKEEMAKLIERHDEAAIAATKAMKEDFASMSPEAQDKDAKETRGCGISAWASRCVVSAV